MINIADIVDGLHRDGDWNEAHEVRPVLQDQDSRDGMARKQFLITRILCDHENNCSLMEYWNS